MHSLNVSCSHVTSYERLVTMSTGVWCRTGISHQLLQRTSLTRLLMPSSMLCGPERLVASWMISTIHLSGHPIHLEIFTSCVETYIPSQVHENVALPSSSCSALRGPSLNGMLSCRCWRDVSTYSIQAPTGLGGYSGDV